MCVNKELIWYCCESLLCEEFEVIHKTANKSISDQTYYIYKAIFDLGLEE